MPLNDDILDQAYAVFAEFGPDMRIDRAIRLQSVFPQLSTDEVSEMLTHMRAVHDSVWQIAEQGAETKLGRERVVALLQDKYPFLREKGLSRAVLMCNYYAWHEGYDK